MVATVKRSMGGFLTGSIVRRMIDLLPTHALLFLYRDVLLTEMSLELW